jgi:hypothetical protein
MSAFLRQSLPAALSVSLKAPTGDGNQALSLTGTMGTADASIEAQLSKGIVNALTAPLAATIKLASADQAAMTAQLGLGAEPLFASDASMDLEMSIDGAPSESYQVRARLESGDDRMAFDGSVVPGDFTSFSGTGNVDVALSDPSVLADAIGVRGLYLPPVEGTARLLFSGADSIVLDSIVAEGAAGRLSLSRNGERVNVTGSLQLATLDAATLLPVLGGAAATIPGEGLWPAGPIDIGDGRRTTTGRVSFAVNEMPIGERPLLTDAAFSVDWTADAVSIRNLTATAGEGVLSFDATVCCGSPSIATRQLSGRLTLAGVPVDVVAPAAISGTILGHIDAAAQFSGTGDTLAAALDSMTGSGSYTISDFVLEGLDPEVFNAAGTLTGIEDAPVESLSVAVLTELSDGEFRSGPVTGSFTIAGGVLRSPNLAIAGDGARLFGSASLDLSDMVVAARYALTPVAIAEAASMVDAATAEIIATISGRIWAPIVDLDVSALVDGMKIRASEIALAALEEARLAEEERQRELAAERTRVAAEQAAAEAARKAAEEEARRAAQEAAAAQAAAAAEAAAQQLPAPLDLGL